MARATNPENERTTTLDLILLFGMPLSMVALAIVIYFLV